MKYISLGRITSLES